MSQKTLLYGIQSSGIPHLGNILGSILPAIKLVDGRFADNNLFCLADLHAMTTEKNSEIRESYSLIMATAIISLGLDINKVLIYRQSYVPSVCELMWYLSCYTPYPMLANAHAFKDKSQNLADVNAGLFTYPILMAADILLYNTTHVVVGKDQIQHMEIARDIAKAFNNIHKDTFVLPEYVEAVVSSTIPGTDGRKMSKSYKNTINIFAKEPDLKKEIMAIKTSSTPMGIPMDFENCNLYNIYKALTSEEKQLEMKEKYKSGNYGFANAKEELFKIILEKFQEPREKFQKNLENQKEIYEILKYGEKKSREIADTNLKNMKEKIATSTKQ